MSFIESARSKMNFSGDNKIWWCVLGLMMFSLLVVYSSTGKLAVVKHGGNTFYFLIRQIVMLTLALVAMFWVQSVHYKKWMQFSKVLIFFSIACLLWAKFSGSLNDTERWVKIPVIGITFQPSEIAKIAIVVIVARLISFGQLTDRCDDRVLGQVVCWTGIPLVLIFMENFSTTLLIVTVCFSMLFIGRMRVKLLMKWIFIGLLALIAAFVMARYIPAIKNIGRVGTVVSRVESFMGIDDEKGHSDNYQAEMAKIAVARGGIFPKGPGTSVQRNYLPHPYSDFIFAIIIEEYGFLIAAFILMTYLCIGYRCVIIVKRCRRLFPALVVSGLGLMLLFQAFINMAVCVGLFPVTGQPLPFVSMGGTSIVLTSISMGIILSVGKYTQEEQQEEEARRQSAAVAADDFIQEDYTQYEEENRISHDTDIDDNVL